MTDKTKSHDPHAIGQAKRQRHADAVAAGTMTYADICRERRAEYTAAIKKLPAKNRAQLNDWAERMNVRFGPKAHVYHNALPWPSALMVSRYGEEVAHWPTSLSDADLGRMADMETLAGKGMGKVKPLFGKTSVAPDVLLHGLDDDDDTTTGE